MESKDMMGKMLSDDALDAVSGGGRSGGGTHSGTPAPLYDVGQLLRILKYDNTQLIVRVRGGTVESRQYKNSVWQYKLDTGWGYSTDWMNEDELGPA